MELNGSKSSTDVGTECTHPELDCGYGFAASSGWRGLGIYEYCTTCYKTLAFSDDFECNNLEEIEHNRIKREALSTLQEVC